MTIGAQLSRMYGIPSYSCPATDSKLADFQAGFEMTQMLLTGGAFGDQRDSQCRRGLQEQCRVL